VSHKKAQRSTQMCLFVALSSVEFLSEAGNVPAAFDILEEP